MAPFSKLKIWHFLILAMPLLLTELMAAHMEFTNLKCVNLDPEFCDFEICRIKAINRTYKHLSVKVNLHEKNVMNVSVNFRFMKKANGYKPFLYNVTVDACKFLRSPYNPVVKYIYTFFKQYSNMNHSCPYNDYLFANEVPVSHVQEKMTKILPFPLGDFGLFMVWSAFNKPRADVRVYVSIGDSKRTGDT